MEKTKIYIEFSDDINELINTNSIDIPEVFREKNINAAISHEYAPYNYQNGERSKDLTLVILASSAAVLAIGAAISQIIRSLYRKPYLIQYSEIEEVRDDKGNIVLDFQGQPIFKPVTKYELLQPLAERNDNKLELKSDGSGIVIKYSSSDDPFKNSKK